MGADLAPAKAPSSLAPLQQLANLSPAAMEQVRIRWVAEAYENLPSLTLQERELARDRMLAAECSMWRVRFEEADADRRRLRIRAEESESAVRHLKHQMTPEERAMAADRVLAARCSEFRVKLRESEKDLSHQTFRADRAEAHASHLAERIDYLNELLEKDRSPESPGASK